MIISCPSCTTKYQVEAAGFMPKGRKVRCAKCGDTWHQDPPKDVPKTLDQTDEAPVEAKASVPPPPANDGDASADEAAPASAGSEAVAARRMASFRKTLTRWRLG